jgi:hypothetical protein
MRKPTKHQKALLAKDGMILMLQKDLERVKRHLEVEQRVMKIRLDGYLAQSEALRKFQVATIHELLGYREPSDGISFDGKPFFTQDESDSRSWLDRVPKVALAK